MSIRSGALVVLLAFTVGACAPGQESAPLPISATTAGPTSTGASSDTTVVADASVDVVVEAEPAPGIVVDFFGELIAADTDDWVVTGRNGGTSNIAITAGGPNSQHEVGPGTLTLADGTVIAVEAGTPGGSYCTLLQGPQNATFSCLVLGQYKPGTTTAAWFATEFSETVAGTPNVVSISPAVGLTATMSAGSAQAQVSISPDATTIGCGPSDLSATPPKLPTAAAYFGGLDADGTITTIICAFDM